MPDRLFSKPASPFPNLIFINNYPPTPASAQLRLGHHNVIFYRSHRPWRILSSKHTRPNQYCWMVQHCPNSFDVRFLTLDVQIGTVEPHLGHQQLNIVQKSEAIMLSPSPTTQVRPFVVSNRCFGESRLSARDMKLSLLSALLELADTMTTFSHILEHVSSIDFQWLILFPISSLTTLWTG